MIDDFALEKNLWLLKEVTENNKLLFIFNNEISAIKPESWSCTIHVTALCLINVNILGERAIPLITMIVILSVKRHTERAC